MVRLRAVSLVFLALPLLCGCSTVKKGLASRDGAKTESSDKNIKRETIIGVVESVNPEQQFVLVRMEQKMNIAAGTKLETRSPNGLYSQLVAGPERKLNFLAADIVQGAPHAGDLVVISRVVVEPSSDKPAAPGGKPEPANGPILTSQPPAVVSPASPDPATMIPGVPPTDPGAGHVPPAMFSSPPPLPPQP